MPADPTTERDHRLAAQIAREAGERLVALRLELHRSGAAPLDVKDEGDRQAHDFIMGRLAEEFPGDAILSEEGGSEDGPGGRERLDADRVWVIDPLDGTREFSEEGRSDWAVHVALVVAEQPVAGAVALPAQGITLATRPASAGPQ